MKPGKNRPATFNDLEPLICDLVNAAVLLTYIMEGELSGNEAGAPLSPAIREVLLFGGYEVGRRADELKDAWYSAAEAAR